MANKNYYAVIMAGGVGSRFWPISTKKLPKQFHDLLGTGKSLIQTTFDRIKKTVPEENILISSNLDYKELILSHLNCNKNQLLLEPCMRNTAPAILYAVLKIYAQNPNAVLIIAPSDHWIDNENEFHKNLKVAFDFSTKEDILMTLGIQPNQPNTGYGYIQFDKKDSGLIKKVTRFTEKPNEKKAVQFIEWKLFMECWNIYLECKSILNAFKKHLPEMIALFSNSSFYFDDKKIQHKYKEAKNISIDYGILEFAKNMFVLPTNFGWNDLGTWGSLYKKLPKDSNKNVIDYTNSILIDANDNLVQTTRNKKVIIKGLKNYIVIEKENVLLIYPKNDEQEIKQIASQVEKNMEIFNKKYGRKQNHRK